MRLIHISMPVPGSEYLMSLFKLPGLEIAALVSNSPQGWDAETIKIVQTKKIPFFYPRNIKDPGFVSVINKLKPDLIICTSFNQRFPDELLSLPPLGCINVHQSLLPKYRGGNPYFWTIYNGEKETGLTIHYMDEGWDTGDIIAQRTVKIENNDNFGTIFVKTNKVGVEMLGTVLKDMIAGKKLPRQPQPKGDFPKAPTTTDNDLHINLRKSSAEVLRHIRAANGYLGAFVIYKTKRLIILTAEEYKKADNMPNIKACQPGQVAGFSPSGAILIKTTDGLILPKLVFCDAYFSGEDLTAYLNIKAGESLI